MGRLFVVSGPAGAGKGTILGRVRAARNDLALSLSCTTRSPREGELDGVNYYFISRDEFERRVEAGEFLEWENVHGNLYGTLVSEVENKLPQGSLVLEIDAKGALNVKKMLPEAVLIFIMPPSIEELERRLVNRNSETPESLAIRLSNAVGEIEKASEYDEVVVNDNLDFACARVLEIIERYEVQTL